MYHGEDGTRDEARNIEALEHGAGQCLTVDVNAWLEQLQRNHRTYGPQGRLTDAALIERGVKR